MFQYSVCSTITGYIGYICNHWIVLELINALLVANVYEIKENTKNSKAPVPNLEEINTKEIV